MMMVVLVMLLTTSDTGQMTRVARLRVLSASDRLVAGSEGAPGAGLGAGFARARARICGGRGVVVRCHQQQHA